MIRSTQAPRVYTALIFPVTVTVALAAKFADAAGLARRAGGNSGTRAAPAKKPLTPNPEYARVFRAMSARWAAGRWK